MHLIVMAIERETPDLIRNNVRLSMIGDFGRMPSEALDRLHQCIHQTSHCNGLTLNLALSYSSRWEIAEAARKIAVSVAQGKIDPDRIDAATVSDHLSTAGHTRPDLLIRTGGDMRISNFLLWQIAYAELYFTDTFWPDFGKQEFFNAIRVYQSRERRFGLTSEQIKKTHD